MSTGRKSQLEKFDAKMRKAQAIQMQEAEAKAKESIRKQDIMEKGRDVMTKAGGNSEDVFMVIARDAMQTFIKTWNNSMESVIRETVRNEVRTMVQEELQAAVKGVFAGINQAMVGMPQMMAEQVQEQVQEEVEERIVGPLSQRVQQELDAAKTGTLSESVQDALETVEKIKRGRTKSVDWSDAEATKEYMFSLLQEAEKMGVDITVGKRFKELGGKFNTAYQRGIPALFGKQDKGSRGTWDILIEMYRNR